MNVTTATITDSTLVVAERNDAGLVCRTLLEVNRPSTFGEADTELAFASLARTEAWELTGANISAPVASIDNVFGRTVAAKLWAAIGTTHEPFEMDQARNVRNGDLVSDQELSEVYVAAATRTESDSTLIRMVGESKTWEDRFSGTFHATQLVQRARRKA